IVNRNFSVVQYVPTLMVSVSSPTQSRALREGVKARWGSMTPQQHKASLVADFLKPDGDGRRIGACVRLAYYYPEALEPVALRFLDEPTYDSVVVYKFVRDVLYKAKSPEECRRLFGGQLHCHVEASSCGI